MKKNNYKIITIFTYIVISLLATGMTVNYIFKKEKEFLEKKYTTLQTALQDKINSLILKKKNATLALTITLANNSDVKEILENKSYKNNKLNDLSLLLRKETDFKNVWFQVLNDKGISLFRSWSKKKNDDLSKVREDIVDMIKEPKILSSISIGRYDMTFKAMVPIFEDKKFIGVIESITHFNSISRGLRKSDKVEPIIIVEEKYTEQLTHPFTKLFLQNHYIANISANKNIMRYIEKIGVKNLINNKNYLVTKNYLITIHPLIYDNKKLATFLVFKDLKLIDNSAFEEYKNNAFLYLGLFIILLGMILYIISYYLYSKEITKLYLKLNKNQEELKQLNKTLKLTVDEEVAKNNKKNRIMFHQSKLAAMGEMIENIAHQWRQPLSIISTAASGIKLKKELGLEVTQKEEVEILDSIVNTSKYLSNTIDDFRYFFSRDKKKSIFDVKEIIEKSINLLQNDLNSKNIKIIKEIESIKLTSYKNEFLQVILNLLNNAKDEFIRRDIEKRDIFIKVFKENKELVIEVLDTAGGIDDEIIDRIFEPYFTTKHQNQGTGIGLYMSQEIITKHMNGTIEVKNSTFEYENRTYDGACFKITLPFS